MFFFPVLSHGPKRTHWPLLLKWRSSHLRRWCAMHTNQLGLYNILNAEGLLILGTNMVGRWQCDLEDALGHLFQDFKYFCHQNKISCSQRKWSVKKLHLTTAERPSFPHLDTKAYNARVILAFLAEARVNRQTFGPSTCSLWKHYIHNCVPIFLWPRTS